MDLQVKSDPESDQYGASQPGEPSPSLPGQRDSQQSKKNAIRKRTKTGCLTCRKRRIKCDEGKPTCTNCIRSKRECEGYNQRLTFKEPLGAYHHHAAFFGHPIYPPHHPDPTTAAQLGAQQQARSSTSQGSPLTIIAPKPPGFYHFEEVYPRHPAAPGNAPLTLSPTQQFSPQNGMPSASFNHAQMPTPISPHIDLDLAADNFFNTVPQTRPEGGNGMFSPFSPVNNRPQQSMFTGPGYAPRPPGNGGDVRFTGIDEDQVDYWSSDDEASMGESEDEHEETPNRDMTRLKKNDVGIQVARRLQQPYADFYGSTQVRTFHGFVGANYELETYIPSSTSSPLNDTQTAAVFWHFVNVTGPSMSLYERHPFDPSPMFQGQPVPKTRQHIWTYTFPIVSFNHPALLQAMLALSSLQMAKLQGIPATASMKHYHLSLRRIAKNYQSATRRTQPATLAATLLLGFYEVWNSDHDKWCKHMWGARAIIKEIPMREMTKAIMGLKRSRRQRARDLRDQRQRQRQQHGGAYNTSMDEEGDIVEVDLTDVNAGLVSQISGQTVTYEDFGHIYNEDGRQRSGKRYTERDIENYEHLSDLYWWYCKMDVYQSILGGTKLFMEYDLWTQCAPRGPFGRIDAIFGTYDHLMLLLGRLCGYSAHDLARKRKAIKKGGQPGAKGPGSTGTGTGHSPPTYPGMMPSSGKVTVPVGFSPPRETTPQSEASDEPDFEESTAAALREWESIRQAFDIFRANLGPDFDPLGPDLVPPQPTPFGQAHSYRTFSIAGIWMNYYMGLIALHRAHPSMPPVAMVAAGMAAHQTGGWATEIGRIASGLTPEDCSNVTGVSTLVGAAFIESCFCLFVAGVQYQNTAQRHWTVRRLHDIARLTGWQSARQIADGCESAWIKAAQFGRGPPYQRPPDAEHSLPLSVWGTARRIDRKFAEVDNSTPDTVHDITGGREEGGKFVLSRSEQSHYALGLLSVEYDLQRLELREEN